MRCLADVAQVLQHPARIGKGRMIGHRLVRKPIPYVRGERDRAATHEEDVLEFRAPSQLPLCLSQQTLDKLPLCRLHQIRDIVVFAEQPDATALNRRLDRTLAHDLHVEATADAFGHLLLHVQQSTAQRTRRAVLDRLVCHDDDIGCSPTDVDDGHGGMKTLGRQLDTFVGFRNNMVVPGGQCLRDDVMKGNK